jgi:molybdopterin molybdotransferase
VILKSADEARTILAGFPTVGVERIPLETADGRVLAEAVRAPEDLPPWSRAAMDGYAVRARDVLSAGDTAGVRLKVRGSVPAGGRYGGAVSPGEAVAISTGGVLPDGADAVVMLEHTRPDGSEIVVFQATPAAANVVGVGEELRRGDVALVAGKRLRPQDLAILASLGLLELDVHRMPIVGLLSTGTEVVEPHKTPGPGQVRDANGVALAAHARRAGAEVLQGGIARDDVPELRVRIAELSARSDVVLLTGGSSVGVRDLTATVLRELGGAILFHGISVRPGKPTLVARMGAKPVVGLPGVPASALVVFDVFVRPLLRRLGGERDVPAFPVARRVARLGRTISSVVGREDHVRVRLVERDGGTWAEPLGGGQQSLASLARADGLVVVPSGEPGVVEGTTVEVFIYA